MAKSKKKNTEQESKATDNKAVELEKNIEELQTKLQETEEKLAKEKADYLRLMAEFETFRRRNAEEKLALVSSAGSELIKGLLPVLDDLERAMEILSKSEDEAAKEGTNLIYNKLFAYLSSKGLKTIEAKGEKFDTDFHEAVTQFPAQNEEDKGKVIDVAQTGYLLNDKVIRYAKVIVGA